MGAGELLLFVVHNQGLTWTRAKVPAGVTNVPAMVSYIRHGGKIEPISDGLAWFPEKARFIPRPVGSSMTVLAQLEK